MVRGLLALAICGARLASAPPRQQLRRRAACAIARRRLRLGEAPYGHQEQRIILSAMSS